MKFILVGKNNGQRVILWSRVLLWTLLVGVASFLGAVLLLVQFADSLPQDVIPFAFFGFIAAASVSFVVVPLVRRLRGPLERLPDVDVAPGSRSFFQRLFSRQALRRSAFALACLATLVALFYAIENWRGRHALENYQRACEAKGEKFHWKDFVPPPVPDAENFALTPLLKPLFDYDGRVHPVRWNDTNGNNRLGRLSASLKMPAQKNAPDSANFFKNELTNLKPWQDFYRGNTNYPQAAAPQSPAADVLLALGKFDPEIQELLDASAKYPLSRFAIHYEDNFSCLLPHLARFKGLAMLLQLRAVAYLENGQPEVAFEETKLSFRLSDSIQSETFLISHLVRLAVENVTLQTMKEGLARHAWNDAQLAHFQNYLGGIDFLAEYDRSMRGERAFAIEGLELARKRMFPYSFFDNSGLDDFSWTKSPAFRVVPSGWFFQNELAICRFHEQFTFPAVDAKAQRVFPQFADEIDKSMKKIRITPYNIFAKLLLPAYFNAASQSARAQTSINLTRLACALERHRLAHGQFPETLDALVPRFLDKLPHDIMNGDPLKYRRTDDGQYLLYSIGWNQKDDGGEIAFKKGTTPSVDSQNGDWVWRIPAKK